MGQGVGQAWGLKRSSGRSIRDLAGMGTGQVWGLVWGLVRSRGHSLCDMRGGSWGRCLDRAGVEAGMGAGAEQGPPQ